MEYIYRVTNRFFVDSEYNNLGNPTNVNEIVSLDLLLCEVDRIYFNSTVGMIGQTNDIKEIMNVRLKENQQFIMFCRATEEIDTVNHNFEFSGYEILDYFDDNSWITNYGVRQDPTRPELYTKFGLLKTYQDVLVWIDLYKHGNQELEQGEYLVYAVWRSIKNFY